MALQWRAPRAHGSVLQDLMSFTSKPSFPIVLLHDLYIEATHGESCISALSPARLPAPAHVLRHKNTRSNTNTSLSPSAILGRCPHDQRPSERSAVLAAMQGPQRLYGRPM